MKISIVSDGKDLLSPLASTFERCSFFILININREQLITVFLNDAETAPRGAEIQAAQLLIDHRVDVVITPQISINAFNVLQIVGIRVYLGNTGTLQENIDAYCQGRLVETKMALNLSEPMMGSCMS